MSWAGYVPPLAHEVAVEPLPRNPLELAEQVQLRLLARVPPLRLEQPLRQVEEQGRPPQVARVDQVQVYPLADDALVRVMDGPTRSGVSSSVASSSNLAVRRSSGSSTQ